MGYEKARADKAKRHWLIRVTAGHDRDTVREEKLVYASSEAEAKQCARIQMHASHRMPQPEIYRVVY